MSHKGKKDESQNSKPHPDGKLYAPHGGSSGNPLKAIISGGVAGGVEVTITYPTEYVKTIMQLYEQKGKAGMLSIGKETVKAHGFTGLYRGYTSLLYFSVPKSAVRFWGFELAKKVLAEPDGRMSMSANFGAGLFAGVLEAVMVVTPMETIKVKLIHDRLSEKPKYKGFFDGVTTIAKQQGLTGCYKGLTATIIKQGSNQMIRMGVFYELQRQWLGDDPKKTFGVLESMAAGVIAGGASVFANTPVDVIKTRMQGLEAHKYNSFVGCATHILKNEGPLAFYKGTLPRLTRVCLDVGLQMTVYTQLKALLDRLWK